MAGAAGLVAGAVLADGAARIPFAVAAGVCDLLGTLLLLASLRLSRIVRRIDRVYRDGVRTRARVLGVKSVRRFSGSISNVVFELDVNGTRDEAGVLAPNDVVERLRRAETVAVRVDPERPADTLVEWDADEALPAPTADPEPARGATGARGRAVVRTFERVGRDRIRAELELILPGREPYRVAHESAVPPNVAERLVRGMWFPAVVDEDGGGRVVVDWAGR